jgi:lysophospholipase L1-like esterase
MEKKIKIGLIGDSTVAKQSGWGPAFTSRFNDQAQVLNYAVNGATLQSLSTRLDALVKLQPDYVLIQFGHNDQKRYDTKVYSTRLRSYVERIRDGGGQPIVLSSVTRRTFAENGKIVSQLVKSERFTFRANLTAYAQAAQAVAAESNVPFIDLHTLSIAHHNRIGPEASMAYNFREDDLTHFSNQGGQAITDLILPELKKVAPELRRCLTPDETGNAALSTQKTAEHTALSSNPFAEIRSTMERRRLEFFSRDSGKPLVRAEIKKDWRNRGDFTRYYAQSIVLFAMRACELDEQLDEANAALQELCQYHLERPQTFFEIHSFPGVCDALARLYIFHGPCGTKVANRLSSETSAVLERTMWDWANEKADIADAEIEQSQTWWLRNSENHHAQHFTTCWAFAGILRNVAAYQDRPLEDGHTPGEHHDAWTAYLKEYLRERARKGTFVEIDSPSYATATLKSVYSFYDFSDDPVLKGRAGRFLELYWALWAEEQIDAVTGGAQTRCYAKSAVRGGSFLRRAAWYVIGFGEPAFTHSSMLPFVTTTWRVPDIVLQVAASRPAHAAYEIRQRRMGLAEKGYDRPPQFRFRTDVGGILRYTYCTPDFIMGSLITEARPTEDWAAISRQNRWAGVIFAGDPDARVYPAPYSARGRSIHNGFWSVQVKGTMISQQLPARSTDWRVFFSTAGLSEPVTIDAWTFAEASQAYVGVCVVEGNASLEQSQFGHWLVCEETTTPVIIEAGRTSDHADLAAFQTAVMARQFTFAESVLTYHALSGDKLTFHADQSRLPRINGTVVDLAPEAVYDSPFVQSRWDSGVVTIQCGQERRILDFNEE